MSSISQLSAVPKAPRPRSISVVVPFLDEEATLVELHAGLTKVLGDVGLPYEIWFVDDGSTDRGGRVVDELAERDTHTGAIHFRRNFGKAAALDAAFKRTRGDVVFTLDADLQDDPVEIPRFLEKLEEGFDLVSGWKQVRHDPVDKTLPSKLFNGVVSRVSGLQLNDFNCGYKAYRGEVARGLTLYGELHRYVPVLAHWQGYRVAEIPVTHHPRRHGVSKYGIERMAKGFFDLLTVMLNTRYRSRPLHLFGLAGTGLGALGGAALFYLFLTSLLGIDQLRPRPLLYLGVLSIMVGVQLVGIGLLAELINRSVSPGEDYYTVRDTREPRAPF